VSYKYSFFKKGEKTLAGMMLKPMPQAPPQWLAYVHVADVDASARKTTELGGKVLAPPMDIPDVGRIAVIQDPQGATIGLFKPA
jgi:predicted enzyme related to lactoylglutathione lyase